MLKSENQKGAIDGKQAICQKLRCYNQLILKSFKNQVNLYKIVLSIRNPSWCGPVIYGAISGFREVETR